MKLFCLLSAKAGSIAKEHMENKEEMHCYDWFFCTKKLDKDKLLKTVLKK